MGKMTVECWKEVFRDAGLTDEDMITWHRCFEKKYPDGHQGFLEWLGIDDRRIEEIRNACR
jgi:hypothetical protein